MEPHERTEKCKEVCSLLSEYLSLELPPDARHAIEAHIAGCAPCIEFAESLRKTVELCRQLPAGRATGAPGGKRASTTRRCVSIVRVGAITAGSAIAKQLQPARAT